ncbi:MAG TPA: DUF5916 domain-containing protein [Vicinamibacteria bacterium]|nr:DUF5916 domain-containing protein [Vicinamibacteria bacterium]
MTGLLALLISAQAAASGPAVRAERLAPAAGGDRRPVHVDGRLDEPAWRLARPASGFRQREPLEGAPATDDTEVRVLFDEDTLYVGVLARDREPDKVIARILERDRLLRAGEGRYRFAGDDAVVLLLDPFHDRRNAFVFGTNANGAEYDALIADESESFNSDWRTVWHVAAQRVPEGWSAEFAIPFRSLRYPASGAPWGFNVYRLQRRKNEETLWSAWSRQDGGFHRVSRAGVVEGLRQLPRTGVNLEVRPFALAGADQDAPQAATQARADAGGDLKWEVRPGLVLDATVNPDFSQVEADEEQVNLTRFSLFLPEKREFFLENAGIFEFGDRGTFETPPFLLFFSRRIGLDEDENEVPVIAGGRLTGRVGGQTVGFLDVRTGSNPLEAPANHAVGRVKRDVGGSSYVGAMVTDKRREGFANTAAGLDASLWLSGSLNLQGFVARTQTTGEGGEGTAARAGFDYETDPLGIRLQWIRIEPETDAQMGFITRTDIDRYGGDVRVSVRPGALGLRRVSLDLFGDYIESVRTGQRLDVYFGPFVRLEWDSGEVLSGFVQHGLTYVDEAFEVSDRLPVPVGDYQADWASVEFQTSASRPVSLWAAGDWQETYGGRLRAYGGGLAASPDAHLSSSLGYRRSTADLPSGSFVADVVSLRVAYAFSTRLAASAYVQWNSLDEDLVGNFRLVYRYRPGSELILALNEERGTPGSRWTVSQRHLALKVNYLARF